MTIDDLVLAIILLKWQDLTLENLTKLMRISKVTAIEFAASLQIAEAMYPHDLLLKSLVKGELNTDNLQFEEYTYRGDHWMFLDFFLVSAPPDTSVDAYCKRYLRKVEELSRDVRAMSIFSREKILWMIFSEILKAPAWQQELPKHLKAFRYYLERHVELDSQQNGHQDLVSHHPVTDIAEVFYTIRLELYLAAIPNLL